MDIGHLLLGLCAFCCLCGSVSTCKLTATFNLNGYKAVAKKTVAIGGMFAVHNRVASKEANDTSVGVSLGCEGFNFRTFRWTQTMLFAIDEINSREDLLPNTDLGYVIYDSCYTVSKAVEGTLTYMTGQDEAVPNYKCGDGPPLAALVGAGGTDLSITTSRILGLYHFPQVSYFSSSSILGKKFQFPTFLRTIPSDIHQSTAMANLVLHFGWTWVGTIEAEDSYGKHGIAAFKDQVQKKGVCIAFAAKLPKVSKPEAIQLIVQTILDSTAKIIVVFSSDVDLHPLILELIRHNVTNRTWIASEAWVTSALIMEPGVSEVLAGTLGFGVRRAVIPGLQEHLLNVDPYADPLTEEFWETLFNCTLSYAKALRHSNPRAKEANGTLSIPHGLCTGEESVARLGNTYSDVAQLRVTYSVYKAVHAVAHALHDMEHCEEGQGPFAGQSCANISNFEPWQLMYYMKHVRFQVPHTGEQVFFTQGEVDGYYDIINWQFDSKGEISYVVLGQYNSTAAEIMTVDNTSIVWNTEALEPPRSMCSENCPPGYRKGIRKGEPVCCFDCILCAEGEITNTTNARECMLCGEDDRSNDAHDACMPKIIEFLAFGEPLGITLIVISVVGALVTIAIMVVFAMNFDTPLVKANDAFLSFSLLFSLVVTFLCSIIYLGKPHNWSCMTSQVLLALGFALCLSSILGKSALLMFRALVVKADRAKLKAMAKAAKAAAAAAAEAAANNDDLDIIVTNTDNNINNNNNNSNASVAANPEEDRITSTQQRVIAGVATLIQAIACTVWLIVLPPQAIKNTAGQNIKIFLECDEGSVIFICCIFAYDILLALITLIFAFIARKLEDHISEGKFITFGMMVFFIVWIAFIPAYLSTRGKFMVAVQIFAILASSFGLLACIFLPKCYILLIKPERNTEELVQTHPRQRDPALIGTSASLSTVATEVNVSKSSIDD